MDKFYTPPRLPEWIIYLCLILVILAVAGCSGFMPSDPTVASGAPVSIADAKNLKSIIVNTDTKNVSGLPWWQWLLIGFLIPDPITILVGWFKSIRGMFRL